MRTVNIGVAGAGVFGSYHAAKIANHRSARLAAIFDPDADRAALLAGQYAARAFDNMEGFLEAVDAVIVAAPASSHFDLGEQALSADKDVFIEKPLATSTPAARALVELAERKQRILQVGHQERYVCEATGLLSRDRPPQRIECVRHVPFSGRCDDVSAVMDLMVHDLDIARQLCCSEVVNIRAEGDHDSIAAELFLASGTIAALSAQRSSKKPRRRMTVIYDDGVIEFDFIRRSLKNSTTAEISSIFDKGNAPLSILDPLAYGADLFVKSILDRRVCGVTGNDAAEVVEWARGVESAAGIASAGNVRLSDRLRA